MARRRYTVPRQRPVTRTTRHGKGTILKKGDAFFSFPGIFPRAVGRTQLSMRGKWLGGWLNHRNW